VNRGNTEPGKSSDASAKARDFVLTLLSRDPEWIQAADEAGVQRIGIDIERLGKRARQRHLPDARISPHTLQDLRVVARHVRSARVFARLNGPHGRTADEVERALDLGATALMLPQFRDVAEAARFIEVVDGRAEVILLIETPAAAARVAGIAAIGGVSEIMVGLNDLHMAMGLRNSMELASSSMLEMLSAEARAAGVRFGFGGVARHTLRGLPIDPDLVLARHAAVRSGAAWIARSFFEGGLQPDGMRAAVGDLRRRLRHWYGKSDSELAAVGARLRQATAQDLVQGC